MTYDTFKNYINYLFYSGNLSIEILEKTTGYEESYLTRYLKGYVDFLLNKIEDYKSINLALPTLMECFETFESITLYRPYLHELYSELQYRTRNIEKNEENSKKLKHLRLCRKTIKEFISKIETNHEELERTEVSKKFNYIWHILTEIRDPEFYRHLTKRQRGYLNISDESYKSIFYRLALEYLENYDEYYLRVLPIILESPDFVLEQDELDKIYEELDKHYQFKLSNKQLLDRMKNILSHYFTRENDMWTIKSSYSHMKDELGAKIISTPVVLDRIDTMDRVNLTKLNTFSLSGKSKTKEDLDMATTIAYSILEKSNGYELFIHVPDVPEFIKENSPENERASYIMEEIKYKHQVLPLIDRNLLCNKTNLLPHLDRMAITFRIELDSKFRMTKLEIFRSTVNNDRIINVITETKDKELKLLSHVAENLSDKPQYDTPRVDHIQNLLSYFLHRELTKLNNGQLPFIYKNLIDHENTDDILKYSSLTEYTNKTWSTHTAKQYLSVYKNQTLNVTIYSPTPLLAMPNTIATARVIDPHASYVALENLRMIKDIIIDKKPTKGEWRERALLNSFIANSANQEALLEDVNVKRLLLTKNNCGKIDL